MKILIRYTPDIYYPKRTDKPLYKDLTTQCQKMGLTFVDSAPSAADIDSKYNLVVDALFGFSFKPPVRESFADVMTALKSCSSPVASVDVPSGWDVEEGDKGGDGLKPEMLVSLTAPKLCARFFEGKHHYLGGRFVPKPLAEKYELNLPEYPEQDTCVRLS